MASVCERPSERQLPCGKGRDHACVRMCLEPAGNCAVPCRVHHDTDQQDSVSDSISDTSPETSPTKRAKTNQVYDTAQPIQCQLRTRTHTKRGLSLAVSLVLFSLSRARALSLTFSLCECFPVCLSPFLSPFLSLSRCVYVCAPHYRKIPAAPHVRRQQRRKQPPAHPL